MPQFFSWPVLGSIPSYMSMILSRVASSWRVSGVSKGTDPEEGKLDA